MTFDEAVELVQKWPDDPSVPRKLAKGIANASEEEAQYIRQLVEVLTTAAASAEHYKLISKYFD